MKESQRLHLQSMLAANWNEEYVAQRFRVGDTHATVGISPQVFLGAYNQYMQFCLRALASRSDSATQQMIEQILSLQKAVFLDIGLTLEAYFTQATQILRQALDLVYRANAELRQFAQLTSHDLKTPLATMANLCDEALDEFGQQMPAESVKLIEAARNRAFRMSQMIDELLSSTMSLHSDQGIDVVSVEDVVQAAVEQLRPLLDQKAIRLTVAPHIPRVLGNFARLREVFYNLLSNAIKFSDKVDSRIDVGFTVRDGECVITVADNGTGIPSEELSRVFVPFRRLPAHRNIPGSGLGLYFVKAIVEQHGGRIWIESTPGQGSIFHVMLRLANSDGDNG
jgi:signal transduction histidine kinase